MTATIDLGADRLIVPGTSLTTSRARLERFLRQRLLDQRFGLSLVSFGPVVGP
jgi:hypothetical protein